MEIKGQALTNFIVEFTYSNAVEVTGMTNNVKAAKAVRAREKENSVPTEGGAEQWTLYVDRASNDIGSGSGMTLISPEGHKIHCARRFGFMTSNNEAKYEALIAGLRLAPVLQVLNVRFLATPCWW